MSERQVLLRRGRLGAVHAAVSVEVDVSNIFTLAGGSAAFFIPPIVKDQRRNAW